MISEKMAGLLAEQLTKELFSSDLYFAISGSLEAEKWPGFSNWMMKQSDEERGHAKRIHTYLTDHDRLTPIGKRDACDGDYGDPLAAFKMAMQHEQMITASIGKLVKAALAEDDMTTFTFLQWFMTEQVEEEKRVSQFLADIERLGDDLFLLDRELR